MNLIFIQRFSIQVSPTSSFFARLKFTSKGIPGPKARKAGQSELLPIIRLRYARSLLIPPISRAIVAIRRYFSSPTGTAMSSPNFVAADIPPARVGQPLNEVDTPACLVDLDALERNIKTAVAMIQKHAPASLHLL